MDKLRRFLVRSQSIKLICIAHCLCILVYSFFGEYGVHWNAFFFGMHGLFIGLVYLRYSVCEHKSPNDRKMLFFMGCLFVFLTPYWVWCQYQRPSTVFDMSITVGAMMLSAFVVFMVTLVESNENC